ncbi:hypothetical protein DPMN_141094 [Dreissena polymorpha]|uniref:Uncharacterized protein n=1 Tax=Dreissena polymorpha TaxID=45954 RepID=A0A9D4GES1_DREPO|nr:hypothetical protein DPMN_141094 [Dreissena polymorpha]
MILHLSVQILMQARSEVPARHVPPILFLSAFLEVVSRRFVDFSTVVLLIPNDLECLVHVVVRSDLPLHIRKMNT